MSFVILFESIFLLQKSVKFYHLDELSSGYFIF